jgi:hypothetical protein
MSKVIAGAEVRARVEADYEHARTTAQAGRLSADAGLHAAQRSHSAQGIKGVGIYTTVYGYSVRYLSGLDNFSIVHPSTTYENAVEFAKGWVARDTSRRYAMDMTNRQGN